jgi:cysteine-rich repeat protein
MLHACLSCPGLVPDQEQACPHCGAVVSRTPLVTKLKALATVAAGGTMMMSLMACYGYVDDGWDYSDDGPLVQCSDDSQCPAGQTCDEWSGMCVSSNTTSSGINFEYDCTDEIDDDLDGDIDCEDSDCDYMPECVAEEICANGADDDQDGYLDCEDSDCPACPETEISCGNLVDDDLDGLADCEDPDCADVCAEAVCGDGALVGIEECDDGDQVDGDGCSATCTLEMDVFCETLPPLVLGSDPSDNLDGTSGLAGSCVGEGGREKAFTFTALADGTLSVSLGSDLALGLYVLEGCAEGALELACTTTPAVGVQVPLLTGAQVTVVVDGAPGVAGEFTISSAFTPN